MRILVIEDNPKMADAIAKGMAEHGYVVDVCYTGFEGEERAVSGEYDLVILDRMLTDRDGIDVCRNLRTRAVGVPILMLTALSGAAATVSGLNAGADGYLTKPFDFDELVARVRALLRRGQATESRLLKHHDLELDLDTRRAARGGVEIKLSGKEFAMLEYLMRNANRVLTRQAISMKVWDIHYEPSSNVIDVVISALRRKADRDFDTPLIHTVVGAGYRFGVMDDATD